MKRHDLNIRIHGDSLEREFADLILNNLPAYDLIWKTYIGHDGKGRMLKATGLDEKQEEIRTKFSQYHYTCLESIAGMSIIKDAVNKREYNNIKDVIQQNNDYVLFHTLAGKIRDSIKEMKNYILLKLVFQLYPKLKM